MEHTLHHAAAADRVRANTWQEVNDRLDSQAVVRMRSAAGNGSGFSNEIDELDRDWDFDRVLETEASLTGLLGLGLGLAVHRSFLVVPGVVAAMVFLYGTQGWYPMLPIFRRMGIRTRDEIDREKYGLKALRGDFEDLPEAGDGGAARAAAAWRAVCA
jgi:hypothetical protein